MAEGTGLNIGRYHLGLMYSESFAGVPNETILSVPLGIGRNDIESTSRIISLLHETTHYVHDLSLGACLNRDFLLDEAAHILFNLLANITQKKILACPLAPEDEIDVGLVEIDGIEQLKLVIEHTINAKKLLSKSYEIDTTSISSASYNKLDSITNLTGMHLLEGIAALKTLHGILKRVEAVEDLDYLQDIREELPLLPDNMTPLYHLAIRLMDASIGGFCGINLSDIRDWPTDAKISCPRSLADLAYLCLADIALHIPPLSIIRKRISESRNTWDDFDPVIRFVTGIRLIGENNGFPDADEGGGSTFYSVLFDFIAQKAGWPEYEETQSTWETELVMKRDVYTRSMSSGFRARMMIERRTRSVRTILGNSIETCMKQAVPILHSTPRGLKLIRMFNFSDSKKVITIPWEFPGFNPWYLINIGAKYWESATENTPFKDAFALELNRGLILMQEVTMRAMCRALQTAVLSKKYLVCPWAKQGCHVAEQGCRCIQQLRTIPQKECALRLYINMFNINIDNLTWK